MIRLAAAAYAEAMAAIYDPVVAETPISFEEEPPGAAGMERRIVEGSAFAPWLVDSDGDGPVQGHAYASRHRERAAYRWSVDVAVYVAADQRGKGVGRALYTSLVALLRLQGFCAAHSGIALPNPRALRSISEWVSRRSGSTVRSATSWAPGATWDDGNWTCASGMRGHRRRGPRSRRAKIPRGPSRSRSATRRAIDVRCFR